jgi:hypothetical protein
LIGLSLKVIIIGGEMGRRIKSYQDIVRPVFPDADEEEAEYLVWNRTAYPFMGKDWKHYRKQLKILKRTLDAGHKPCEHCSEQAIMDLEGGYGETFLCWNCFKSGIFDNWRERNNFANLLTIL